MSEKHWDMWTIPVCRRCHDRWHASLTYRQLGELDAAQSEWLMAETQLRLMSHWILLIDKDSNLF